MSQIHLVSYATERFENVRQELNRSAKQFGIIHHFSYTEQDLKASAFFRSNQSILNEVCGAGYWAWKPYFILRALEKLNDGDVIFYCDAGSAFIDSPEPLVKLAMAHSHGLVLFDARPLKNRQFCKRDCFVQLDCDRQEYWDATKLIATVLVVRKSPFALSFLSEWLFHCQNRAAITDDVNVCGTEDLQGFLQHRHDQSILSILAAKHKIETFRNPTLWGNFLKLPEFRVAGEQVVSPFCLIPEILNYSEEPQSNSRYGTIFLINQQPNMVGKQPLPQVVVGGKSLAPKNQYSFMRKVVRKLKQVFQ